MPDFQPRTRVPVRFLKEMLGRASPATVGGAAEAKVIDAVNHAAATIDASYAHDPDTLAELHATLGSIYSALDENEKARSHHQRAAEIVEQMPNRPAGDVRALASRGWVAITWAYAGQFAEAAPRLCEAIEAMRAAGVTRHETLTELYSALGVTLRRLGQLDEAMEVYRAGVESIPPDWADSPFNRATFTLNIASVHHAKGDAAGAERGYREAFDSLTALRGPDCDEAQTAANNLAVLYLQRGRYDDALTTLQPLQGIGDGSTASTIAAC